jgi:hypothetical protein
MRHLAQLLGLRPIDFTVRECCVHVKDAAKLVQLTGDTAQLTTSLPQLCFHSPRGHTVQMRLTGSASVRQFDSADRRTTSRALARLLKHPKSLNSTSVSATRAQRPL